MDSELESHGGSKRCRTVADQVTTTATTATGMESLPLELVLDILSRLPITSLVQFYSTCRAWRALARNPHLVSLLLDQPSEEEDPCLILHCDSPIRNQLFFWDSAVQGLERNRVRKIYSSSSDLMSEFNIVGSSNGLLCVSDSLFDDTLCIYNPFTGKNIKLPQSINYPDQEVIYGFGFHPKTKEYKVIKIVYYRNGTRSYNPRTRRTIYRHSEVQILTVGCTTWRSIGKVPYGLIRRPSRALVNGRLHWVCRPCGYMPSRRLISFDLAGEDFQEVPIPDSGGLNRCNFHLCVLGGCLSAAVYGNNGRIDIWVMKQYNVKESWTKEYYIGNYIPKGLKESPDHRSFKLPKSGERAVKILCLLKNGDVLLEYKNRALAAYSAKHHKFKEVVLQGLPSWFFSTVHVGSLNWIDTPLPT